MSESEQFKYLLASTILYSIGMIPFLQNNMMDVYSAIVSGIITILGTYYVYKANGGSEGKDFLQRFISIGLVVAVRWFVLVMIPLTIVFFFLIDIFLTDSQATTIYDVAFFNSIYLIYFWLLGKHIKELSPDSKKTT